MRALVTIVITLLIAEVVPGQQKVLLRFEDYPVTENSIRSSAPVKIVGSRARMFRTVLRENAEQGANFAGHYIAATWGCGSACWSFAIIDARSGQVHFTPFLLNVGGFGYTQEDLIQFRKDSRLLMVVGAPNDKGFVGRYYYIWKKNRLTLIQAIADQKFSR